MPLQPASDAIALQMTGDLGGITYVQRAGNRRTSYAKTYPARAPSPLRLIQRNKFAEGMKAWKAQPANNKLICQKIVDKYEMCLLAHNLFLSCFLNERESWLVEWAEDVGEVWE